jgi:hydrogenase nickel incorporation protein HypA/HybF
MHELAIAESIVTVVKEQAEKCHASHVSSVRLQIGEANAIVVDSLTFCFEMITALEPLLAGAQLETDSVPHRARCRQCRQEFAVVHLVACCPTCETWDAEIISGTEFRILDMEIESSG